MSVIAGVLAPGVVFYDNPDKTINIDRFDDPTPWWTDDPYIGVASPHAAGIVVSTQPRSVVHWPVQGAGVMPVPLVYGQSLFVMTRI